jgi:hypothetical protein
MTSPPNDFGFDAFGSPIEDREDFDEYLEDRLGDYRDVPTSGHRTASDDFVWGEGDHVVEGGMRIASVQNVHLFGKHEHRTRIFPVGGSAKEPLLAGLHLDGVFAPHLHDFTVYCPEPGQTADSHVRFGIVYEKSGQFDPLGISSRAIFERVGVQGRFLDAGWVIGGTKPRGLQADQASFLDCHAVGVQHTTGKEYPIWQTGWKVGDGANGNVVRFEFARCSTSSFNVGMEIRMTDATIRGGNWQSCNTLFSVNGVHHVAIRDLSRVENVGTLLHYPVTRLPGRCTVENVLVNLDAPRYRPEVPIIRYGHAGRLRLVQITFMPGVGWRPGTKPFCELGGQGDTVVLAEGLDVPNALPHEFFQMADQQRAVAVEGREYRVVGDDGNLIVRRFGEYRVTWPAGPGIGTLWLRDDDGRWVEKANRSRPIGTI